MLSLHVFVGADSRITGFHCPLLALMTVLSKLFLSFMSRNLLQLALSSTGHNFLLIYWI